MPIVLWLPNLGCWQKVSQPLRHPNVNGNGFLGVGGEWLTGGVPVKYRRSKFGIQYLAQ
jgi:hypothetical protein